MVFKGILKRWICNSGFIVSAFAMLVIALAVLTRGYFYSGIYQNITSRSKEFGDILECCSVQDEAKFVGISKIYVENFKSGDKMRLTIFDNDDKVIVSSTGFLPDMTESFPDYDKAKISDKNISVWEGKLPSGEKVMAVSRYIYDDFGNYLGALRYDVSMEGASSRIHIIVAILFLCSILIIMFILIFGIHFIKSIVRPIDEICSKARLIARGDFHIKLDKKYDDEIGELSDTVNYMAEELDAAEKIKNEFISSVSHELRTPLTAIKGWAETIQLCEESDVETRKRGLDTIVREVARLSWIVEGLLDFSSIKEKRIKLIKEKIDILAELGEAVYMFKDRAKNEGKTLMYNEPKILPPVRGDRHRLKQVFINILDNALKYTSEGGGISVNVSVKNERIYISVTDNGCGIPLEHLPNVTKKFYKANYLQRGSGIGLAIVDEIVTLHNGKLEIISEEKFGTTVTVSLPIDQEEPQENAPAISQNS
ncbi:MAG: ATP-binding protein [Acutalibacteraceae bacterium]